jgi:hypothetical protein
LTKVIKTYEGNDGKYNLARAKWHLSRPMLMGKNSNPTNQRNGPCSQQQLIEKLRTGDQHQ